MKKPMFIVIAIDGGAASGKSSTSSGVANRLNCLYVDTGQHYRLLTHVFNTLNIPPSALEVIKSKLPVLTLKTKIEAGRSYLQIEGYEDVSLNELRSEAVNSVVSQYSAIPELREVLLKYERSLLELAKHYDFQGVVMEGRDIGTVILPHADFKFYLYADLSVREKRRATQGHGDTIAKRDIIDSRRATAPLFCAADAIKIDNSALPLEDVIAEICDHVCAKIES